MRVSFIEKSLNYDLLYMSTRYLTLYDLFNLLLSSKTIYNIYYVNKSQYNKLLIRKVFYYFNFNTKLNLACVAYRKDKYDHLFKCIYKIFRYFKYHPYSSVSDFLSFIIENKLDCMILFKFFLEEYTHTYEYTNDRFRMLIKPRSMPAVVSTTMQAMSTTSTLYIHTMTIYDLKYIMVHSSVKELRCLFYKIIIDKELICYTIDELAKRSKKMFIQDDDFTKIKICIDYLFKDTSRFNVRSFDYIIINTLFRKLYRHGRHDIVNYFLAKRKNIK